MLNIIQNGKKKWIFMNVVSEMNKECNPIFGKFVPDLRYLKTYLMPGLRYLLGVCMTSLHRAWSSKFNRISILHHCKVKVGEVMEKDRKYWFNCLMLYKHCGESWLDICIEHVATFLNIPEKYQSWKFILHLMKRYKGSNTGKRARRKNLRHPRERFLVSNEALPSWRSIEIFPMGWDKDISHG